MKVKGFLKDVGGASRVTKARQAKFDAASAKPKPYDPIGAAAKALHPGRIALTLEEIREVNKTTKTLVFTAPHLPYFIAGQSMIITLKIGDSLVSRPYSISSAPYQTRGEHPILEITVHKPKENGFVAPYLCEQAKVGDVYEAEVGGGVFYHDPIRDSHDVVALAGGSGITPFLSMAREIRFGKLDINLTILFGSVNEEDIILRKELEECVCDKVKVVHVLSGENPGWKGEKGFLTAELIKRYSPKDATYFVCGPNVMYGFVQKELAKLGVSQRRIHLEVPGMASDISAFPGYPKEKIGKTVALTVVRGIHEEVIEARCDESIATALERAGIFIHIGCRSGVCAHCRVKVLSGDFFVKPAMDGRRAADVDFGYVHSCATYPLTDLKIKVNIA